MPEGNEREREREREREVLKEKKGITEAEKEVVEKRKTN